MGGDLLHGEAGDDHFIIGLNEETIDGGEGTDTLDLSQVKLPENFAGDASAVEVRLTLRDPVNPNEFLEEGAPEDYDEPWVDVYGNPIIIRSTTDIITRDTSTGRRIFELEATLEDGTIEHVVGTPFNDYIASITDRNNQLSGGEGNDELRGGRGNDTLDSGAGNDTLYGSSDDDVLVVTAGTDEAHGGIGDDTYYISRNSRNTRINDFDWGSNDENHLILTDVRSEEITFTYSGQDLSLWLDGPGGTRIAYIEDYFAHLGGPQFGSIRFADGYNVTSDVRQFVLGRIENSGGVDTIIGTEGNNLLPGDNGPNLILGLSGNDELIGLRGDDGLYGGLGQDILFGGRGNDTLNGGADTDYFEFRTNDGTNVITDFRVGEDIIALRGGLAFEDFQLSTSADGDAQLTHDQLSITLSGVDIDQLDASHVVEFPNLTPSVTNDVVTTYEDVSGFIINVLGNDTDRDGDHLTVTEITQPSNGSAVINSNGSAARFL